MLEGVPGIGKTTLWRAGVMRAERSGALVLTARPTAAEARLPYSALGDLVRGVPPDALEGLPAPLARRSPGGGAARGRRGRFPTVALSPAGLPISFASSRPEVRSSSRSTTCNGWMSSREPRSHTHFAGSRHGAGAAGPPSTDRDEHRARGLVAAGRRGSRAGRAAEPFRAARDPGRAHPCTPASSGARQDLARIGRQPVLRDRARQGADPGGDTRKPSVELPHDATRLTAESILRFPPATQAALLRLALSSRELPGAPDPALQPAIDEGLVEIDGAPRFSHPLVLAAVVDVASPTERRAGAPRARDDRERRARGCPTSCARRRRHRCRKPPTRPSTPMRWRSSGATRRSPSSSRSWHSDSRRASREQSGSSGHAPMPTASTAQAPRQRHAPCWNARSKPARRGTNEVVPSRGSHTSAGATRTWKAGSLPGARRSRRRAISISAARSSRI